MYPTKLSASNFVSLFSLEFLLYVHTPSYGVSRVPLHRVSCRRIAIQVNSRCYSGRPTKLRAPDMVLLFSLYPILWGHKSSFPQYFVLIYHHHTFFHSFYNGLQSYRCYSNYSTQPRTPYFVLLFCLESRLYPPIL